ncbi:MAG: PQQ-dependent dehydrogenase, methanol/ethanol family [Acidobacteria bacterium]|nr:PQQ-dependent dehydrogenase, methanol/ethanol family [Acidobacteriota bacterium]
MIVRFLLVAGVALAQSPHGNPVARGSELFEKNCAACHGARALGGRAPNLTRGDWKSGGSDEAILRNIVKGIAGTQMPAFPMPEEDAKAVVAYLRSLEGSKPETAVTGDARAGAALFFGAAGCGSCHMVQGRGGRLGPDLTTIAQERRQEDLRQSVREPSAKLRAGFRTVNVKLRDGRTLTGVAKNEDTFSIQLMDRQEKLHLLDKAGVSAVTPTHQSLMPAAKLTPAETNDVLAFLKAGKVEAAEWKPAADWNVTWERIRNARREPQNWLTYWGDLTGQHFSELKQVTPANVRSLRNAWTYQFGASNIQTVPIVVDGLMFVTGPRSNAAALDARTGRRIWEYKRELPEVHSQCTVMTNRGVAVLGDRVYLATLDAHLVALDAKTGNVIFDVEVEDYRKGFSITHAPLALNGQIAVGITAGECALTGFVYSFDAKTGKRLWRTDTVAPPGDPNRGSWAGDSAKYGGAPTWMTGTFDVETNTLFWTTGNPGPDYNGVDRAGDNLYSDSVLALDPATGRIKWHFQYTPHDVHDWDANETPVLVDAVVKGQRRKLLIMANRNAFYYAIDRVTGEFVAGQAFANQTWAKGLDARGRPIVLPNTTPTPEGNYACPDALGATNFAAPSFSPVTGLFYLTVRETCATYFTETKKPEPGQPFTGGGQREDEKVGEQGFIRALDPATGDRKWSTRIQVGSHSAGVLATAGGLVFAGSREGNLMALDAATGKILWHHGTGASIRSSPMAYAVDGRQYVAIANDAALLVYALEP